MVLFEIRDIILILTLRKKATCRDYPLKVGKIYKGCIGFLPYFCKFKVVSCKKLDINKLNKKQVNNLGFKTKKEYLNMTYSNNHIKYYHEFELIESNINEFIQAYKK